MKKNLSEHGSRAKFRLRHALILLTACCGLAYLLSKDSLYVPVNARITNHAVASWSKGSRPLVYYYEFTDAEANVFAGNDTIHLTRHTLKNQALAESDAWIAKHPIGSALQVEHMRNLPAWNQVPQGEHDRFGRLLPSAILAWMIGCLLILVIQGGSRGIKAVWKR